MGWQDRDYHREGQGGGFGGMRVAFPPFTPLFVTLLSVNLLLFLTKVSPRVYHDLVEWGALQFEQWIHVSQLWRWFTYQYLHGSGEHVFFNMLSLYFFLHYLEGRWGWQRTLGFYTLGGIAAGLCYLLLVMITGRWESSVIGASGCVLAVIGAVAYLYPEIRIFFIIPVRVFAVALGVLYLLTTVGDRNFSDAAHLGGLVFGFVAPWLAGPFLAEQMRRYQAAQKERAIQEEIDEQKEVDRILAKVAEQGMNSLTSREKKTLEQATKNQIKRDQEREKRIRASW